MCLKSQIKNRLTEKFIEALPAGAGVLAPRNGYYFIKDITFGSVDVAGEVPVALVNWTPDLKTPFFSDITFEVALLNLYSANPNAPKEINYSDLIGQVIAIYEARIMQIIENHKLKKVLNCKWAKIHTSPIFTDTQTMTLQSFFGNSKTISEAYSAFEHQLGIDFSDSIEFEATIAYEEDPTTGNDVYDDYLDEAQTEE